MSPPGQAIGGLWLGYPRPKTVGRLEYEFTVPTTLAQGGEYVSLNEESAKVTGGDVPWLFSSNARGLLKTELMLLGKNDPPARYTVNLYFAELEGAKAGERVFDIRETAFRKAFREAATGVGLPDLRPYDLRHAFACALLADKVPVAIVRDLLGHKNIATTDIYLRSLPDDAAEAAIDRLSRAHSALGASLAPAGQVGRLEPQ